MSQEVLFRKLALWDSDSDSLAAEFLLNSEEIFVRVRVIVKQAVRSTWQKRLADDLP
jgi:hypothetical protein